MKQRNRKLVDEAKARQKGAHENDVKNGFVKHAAVDRCRYRPTDRPLLSLALLDIYGRQVRISLFVALQVLLPMGFAFDAACNWSKTPGFRGLAAGFNGLYGFMFTLGIITAATALIRETSWLSAARLTAMIAITTTYFVNVVPLVRLGKTVRAYGDNERQYQEMER